MALDIKAAFDEVGHKGLLAKLDANAVKVQLLQWLSRYLMDRCIQVVVNGQTSNYTPINASILQRSIIGPTLMICATTCIILPASLLMMLMRVASTACWMKRMPSFF